LFSTVSGRPKLGKTMFLLLDLDNTLLPSKQAYDYAITELSKDWKTKGMGSESDFISSYSESRKHIKIQLGHHSSNRLRLLCFKNLLDQRNYGIDGMDIDLLLWLEERYFFHFGKSLCDSRDRNPDWAKLFIHLKQVFETGNALILTNENLRTQLLKLRAFFPENLRILFLTSEEIGIEKPHPNYFEYALKKVNKKPSECMMIGDNWEDDISGANSSGISGIHLKSIFGQEKIVRELNSVLPGIKNFETDHILSAIEFALGYPNS
jgi:FMN phosphatase YigB (HAD superfamily)